MAPSLVVMRACLLTAPHTQQGVILWDPGAAVSVIRDQELFVTLQLNGDHERIGGVEQGSTGVPVAGYGTMVAPFGDITARFVPDSAANLLADKDAKEHFLIERIYNGRTDAYKLTYRADPSVMLYFDCNLEGVCVYDCRNAVSRVVDNVVFHSYYQRLGLTKAEIGRMMEVHRFHEGAGYIARDKMVRLVTDNNIGESRITPHDIRAYYEHMHSRACWACRAGKATAPAQVIEPENVVVSHVCGEMVYIDFVFPTEEDELDTVAQDPLSSADTGKKDRKKMPIGLLQAIDAYSGYSMAVQVEGRSARVITLALEKFLAAYKLHGHDIKVFEFDSEGAFGEARINLAMVHGVNLQRAPGGSKSTVAERNNRTAKDQWRTLLSGLEYPSFPSLRRFAYIESLRVLNLSYRTANDHKTVQEVFTGVKPHYMDYARNKWGQLVSYYRKRQGAANSEPRAAVGIIVGRDSGCHNNQRIMNIESGVVVTKAVVQEMDITEGILRSIRDLGGLARVPRIEVLGTIHESIVSELDDHADAGDNHLHSDFVESALEEQPTQELTLVAPQHQAAQLEQLCTAADMEHERSAQEESVAVERSEPIATSINKPVVALRRSTRLRAAPARWDDEVFAFNINLKKAKQQFGVDASVSAVRKELRQIQEKGCWQPLKASERIPAGKKALPSMILLKDK